jgi:UDP-glucose 4-epimerase
LDVTVLRYYHVIGPRQDDSDNGGVVPIFIRNCERGEPITIFGTGEQIRSFTSVGDVVAANLIVADDPRARGEYFNCASGIQVSIQQLADFVKKEMGTSNHIQYADWRPGDIIKFDIVNEKLLSLGVTFETDWKQVVRGTIESRNEEGAKRSS